ncbi:MAG: acyl carrier protein [Desulfobacterales bacterium]|nr:acyl carrier protein [Desulfobacterales bacterium]
MERESIFNIVIKYLDRALDGIDADKVDGSKSMVDLGANSLDIVEVVSSTMRELRIKVPRSKLKEMKNINALVDFLHETMLEKENAEG